MLKASTKDDENPTSEIEGVHPPQQHQQTISGDGDSDLLLEQVKCHICTEIFHNPVVLHFCGHVFCGGCVKRWLENHKTCPFCRTKVKKVTDDFRANGLLEVYLMINPTKARSQAELQELDAEYKRGDRIRIGLNADSEDDISDSDDDEEVDRGPLFHEPCPTCDPNNRFGYVCPVPVPTAPGQQIRQDLVVQGHQSCGFCGNLMPVRGIVEETCASCGTYSCNSIQANECPYSILSKFGEFDLDSSMRDDVLITANAFNQNVTEYQKFMNYKHQQNMTTRQLQDDLLQFFQRNPEKMKLRRPWHANVITADSLICQNCATRLLTDHIIEWWAIQVNQLKVIPDNRGRCWYGVECRTQRHSLSHQQRLNHLGPWIPEEERIDAHPETP